MTSVGDADERRSIAAARGGDRSAFEALVRRYADPVYGHALRFFGDPHLAEDAAQEVFIKVFRSMSSFDGRSAFSTWLFRVTRNVCLDMARQRSRRPVPVDTSEASVGGVEGSLALQVTPDFSAGVVMSTALERALSALPALERDAFCAVALFGLAYAEAADALGVPAGTVKSRVFRARRSLLAELGLAEGGA